MIWVKAKSCKEVDKAISENRLDASMTNPYKTEVDTDYLRDLERIKDAAIHYYLRRMAGDSRDEVQGWVNLQDALRAHKFDEPS